MPTSTRIPFDTATERARGGKGHAQRKAVLVMSAWPLAIDIVRVEVWFLPFATEVWFSCGCSGWRKEIRLVQACLRVGILITA